MPVQILLRDTSVPQAWILNDATPRNDGVMTALQAAQLAALVAGGSGGGGYGTIQNAGVALPQRQILNFDGTLLLAADDNVNMRTNITAPGLVPKTTQVIAGVGLDGGGALSANVTLDLADTAVAPAAYGNANHVATFTVDQQGRLIAAATSATDLVISSSVTATHVPYASADDTLDDMPMVWDDATQILILTASSTANARAPLVIESPVATTIGAAIALDATNAGGDCWSWISTGTAPDPGAGKLGAYLISGGYILLLDGTALYPYNNDALDLGKTASRFQDLYLDGAIHMSEFFGPTYEGTSTNVVAPTWVVIGSGGGAPAFQNSWVNFGGAAATAAFFKDVIGQVHLRGSMKDGTAASVCFTLPAGFRPSAQLLFPPNGQPAVSNSFISVSANGDVSLNSGTTSLCPIDGVIFMAEA